jgi:hypothetical protein
MKKILLSIATIALVSAVSVRATGAFFTGTKGSTNNKFTTGTLEINVLDQNLDSQFVNKTLATNWLPGQEVLINFDVKNTGTVPLQLRGYASGTWGNSTLDSLDKVKVVKVERYDGGWQELASNPLGITGYFYNAAGGMPVGPYYDVAPGARAQFQLTVKLSDDAGNEFQTGTFTSSIHVEARQATTLTTTWP